MACTRLNDVRRHVQTDKKGRTRANGSGLIFSHLYRPKGRCSLLDGSLGSISSLVDAGLRHVGSLVGTGSGNSASASSSGVGASSGGIGTSSGGIGASSSGVSGRGHRIGGHGISSRSGFGGGHCVRRRSSFGGGSGFGSLFTASSEQAKAGHSRQGHSNLHL
jgi:hypothetical protein